MSPLADTHVHLLAGLDDGPRDEAEAIAMCRMLAEQGVRHATALAHQNEDYPENNADRLRAAAMDLTAKLRAEQIPLTVYPTGEIRLSPTILDDWTAGKLLSVGDHRQVLLVEMPFDMFIDVRPLCRSFRSLGVRLMIAHAERYPELLQERGLVEEWVELGCLIQITAERIVDPRNRTEESILKEWAKRGVIHALGSDGHRSHGGGREPKFAGGYRRLAEWTNEETANRIASVTGVAILQGLRIPAIPKPSATAAKNRSFFGRLFG